VIGWLLEWADAVRDRRRRVKWSASHALGRRGEDLTHRLLEREGLRVVARNYRTPSGTGEIDLIAWEEETLVFVEVKTRQSEEHGAPDRAIDTEKIRRIRRAALHYARRAHVPWQKVRFDTVSIVIGEEPALSHRRDAFSVPGPA